MKPPGLRLLFLLALLGSTFGCADRGEGEAVVNEMFNAVKAKDYELASSYHAVTFLGGKTPKSDFLRDIKSFKENLGDLQSWKQVMWSIKEKRGTADSGTYYYFIYETTYSNGVAREGIRLHKPSRSEGSPQIVEHRIELDGVP